MMDGLFQSVDIYCERTDASFWAEPINAITNAAFLLAALFAALAADRYGVSSRRSVTALIVLMIAIGTGSFLFHTVATVWAALTDVVPILIFQITFLGVYAANVAQLSRGRVAMLLLGFVVFSQAASALPYLNGSLSYVPALLFLTGFGIYHKLARKNEPDLLLVAAMMFAVSLGLRTLDLPLCGFVSDGTHYFWH